jgi:acyl-CoA reductase-like NAD-dependent aldehyde dehydrogenase
MRMFVGGELVPALDGRIIYAINPATGKRIATLPRSVDSDASRAKDAARKAFPLWEKQPVADRCRIVKQFADLVRRNAAELAGLETAHRGTPVRYSLPGFTTLADELGEVSEAGIPMMDQRIDQGPSSRYYLRRAPLGTCSFGAPWHVPFRKILRRVAAALVAGNVCVVKYPAHDSLSALRVAELMGALDIPRGVVNIIPETTVGRADPAQSHFEASRPVPLGEPLPLIILSGGDVAVSVERSSRTAFADSGVVWPRPGRHFVHGDVYDTFAEKLVEAAKRIVVDDPVNPATELGPALSRKHRDLVFHHVRQAIDQGATLLTGRRDELSASLKHGYFLPPTVLGDVTYQMRIALQPLFGPVVCLSRFSSIEQIVQLAAQGLLGSGVQIVAPDPSEADRVFAAIEEGLEECGDECQAGLSRGTEEGQPSTDFAVCTRLVPVFKNYTQIFVSPNRLNQN